MSFLLVSCGMIGSYSVEVATELTAETDLVGIPGAETSTEFVDVVVTENTIQDLTVKSIAYEITRNDGGSGEINLSITDVGEECDMDIPLATIRIVSGETTDGPVPLPAGFLIDKLNERIDTGYRLCFEIVQDIASDNVTAGDINPIDIHIKLPVYVSASLEAA
ncbi:MAG: hypothetical protein GXP46_01910 [Deferribacteres bacterium]|nr:hypothetical protein [Deferribacteres bacterium]